MDKWEYSWLYIGDELRENPSAVLYEFNAAGEEGWEITTMNEDTGHGVKYLMKRKKARAADSPKPV